MASFSERHGFERPKDIQFREELPLNLRLTIFGMLRQALAHIEVTSRRLHGTGRGWADNSLWGIVNGRLNRYGTGSLPLPKQAVPISKDEDVDEVRLMKSAFAGCSWDAIYSLIEDTHDLVRSVEEDQNHWSTPTVHPSAVEFRNGMNEFFVCEGIGWNFSEDGTIVARIDEPFARTLNAALTTLEHSELPTSAGHLRSALRALSERPKINTAGAVAHATNAVECVLGEVTGDASTLGKYLDKHRDLFHPSLRKGLDGIYGYASDMGARHGKEGIEPSREDAEFIVAACSAICTLLIEKHK